MATLYEGVRLRQDAPVLLHLLAATGVLAALTLLPGPDMAVVTRRTIAAGRRDGVLTGLGVVGGLLVWGVLTALGLAALLAASPTAYLVLKVLGVAYLLFLGVQALRGSPTAGTEVRQVRGRGFVAGLTTNLLNPKIAMFYTALLPTLVPPGMEGALGLVALVLIHAVVTSLWLGGYAVLLSRAGTVLQRPLVRRRIERLTGVVLLGFAARLALARA